MKRYLLDVNVLIALIDPQHVRHDEAHRWFKAAGNSAWASCPITQLGVLRIVGSARYPNPPGTPAVVAESLRSLCASGDHEFWTDDLSLVEEGVIDPGRILQTSQLTDTYLLAIAARHHGKLATFDRRLVTSGVWQGAQALHVIL